ncbi:hypothetical protein [Photobacterium leiognathi]|uniref:hypothetical protein n=1 Tax=Photobacterium leiognathi TaxID=553611 RepID=UPI0029818CF7|nr:hypothetical protein [Photobacterium leiognathi]
MSIDFIILNLIFICNLTVFISLKQYRSSCFIWFVCYFTLFVSPSYYIIFGGDAYNLYTNYGVEKYNQISAIYGAVFFVFLVFKNKSYKSIDYSLLESRVLSNYTWVYVYTVFFLVSSYVIFYFKEMPFYSILLGQSFVRPDTVHNGIKFYFTFSVFMDVICPSLYFLIRNEIKNKLVDMFLLLLVSFFLIVGGSKGTLIYFFIFYWFSVLDLKVSKKFFILLIVSFVIYFFIKNISFTNINDFFEAMVSPLRRFFVTQGIAIPIRFDMDNFGLFNDVSYQDIKFVVFKYVYGYEPGSMPIMFFPDLIIKFGYFASCLILSLFFFVLFYISKVVDTSKSYFYHWMFYILSFSVLMSGFSEANLYRIIAGVLNIYIVFLLSKSRFKNVSVNNYTIL